MRRITRPPAFRGRCSVTGSCVAPTPALATATARPGSGNPRRSRRRCGSPDAANGASSSRQFKSRSLEPISYIGTCATEARRDAVRGGGPEGICRYFEGPRRRNAPGSPRPSGLRPGRSAASLPSSTISTYGLRRAPCIRSVLAATHHAPIYEIGSGDRPPVLSEENQGADLCLPSSI